MEENVLLECNFDKLNFKVHEARWAEVTDQWKNFVSLYPYNRLYLVTEGYATISLKDKMLELVPGYCYFLPPFQVVTANCEQSMVHYFIHFQECEESLHSVLDFFELPNQVRAADLTLGLFQTAVANRLSRTPEEACYLQGALRMLLAPFFRGLVPRTITNPRLFGCVNYILHHLGEDISIPTLAEQMNLTVNHFSSLFKKKMGMSPKKFILQKKLDRAQLLLSDPKYNVSEIAYQLGFENETYFSRLFRTKMNMSPSQYRGQFAGKKND